MAVPSKIVDPSSGKSATVTKFGQLVVAPVDYSTPVSKQITTINTAFNFASPEAGQDIVITDIILIAARSAPISGSIVEVYESLLPSSITPEETILVADLPRQENITLTGLNLFVPGGRFVNVKSDGVDISATIMFYRVPKEVL